MECQGNVKIDVFSVVQRKSMDTLPSTPNRGRENVCVKEIDREQVQVCLYVCECVRVCESVWVCEWVCTSVLVCLWEGERMVVWVKEIERACECVNVWVREKERGEKFSKSRGGPIKSSKNWIFMW